MYIPFIVLAFVLSLIVRVVLLKQRRAELPGPEDPRWHLSQGEQLAGRSCKECDLKITTAIEGVLCEECAEPVHRKKCKKAHKAMAHRPDPVGPYR